MIDPATLLQTAYFTLLNGQVSYGGSTVPVYDTVPSNATYPYIQFSDDTDTEFSNKTTQGNEYTKGISIVDRFQASTGGRASVNSISSSVIAIITARPVPFSISGLNVVTSLLDNKISRQELTTTYHYRIVEIRFRHTIEQTT